MAALRRENFRSTPHFPYPSPPEITKSKSDTQSRSSNQGADHKDPVEILCESDAKMSQDWWWLHLQTELGNCGEIPCQKVQTSAVIHGGGSHESIDSLEIREDQKVVEDIRACHGYRDDNNVLQKPCEIYPATIKYDQDVQMLGVEAILNSDSHKRLEKKDQVGTFFPDCEYREVDIADSFLSENDKNLASDLKSHQAGFGKAEPWWRNARKDDLATMVAQKSLEHLENCDLPQPLTKYFRIDPISRAKVVNHDGAFMNTENRSMYLSHDSDKEMSQKIGPNLACKNDHFSTEDNIKAELFDALCHSQTRARAAEKAAERAHTEKEHVTSLFFRQASQLFAYRQWFYLLQLENLCLQFRPGNLPKSTFLPAPCSQCKRKKLGKGRKRKNDNQRNNGSNRFSFAFAVGLGLAGAGLLLGWTLGLLLPPV